MIYQSLRINQSIYWQYEPYNQSLMNKNQLIYCYNKKNPDSLVILQQPDIVIAQFLIPKQQNNYVWIIQEEKIQEQSYKIQEQLGLYIVRFLQFKNFLSYVYEEEDRINDKFILILSQEYKCEARQILSKNSKLQKVILYPASSTRRESLIKGNSIRVMNYQSTYQQLKQRLCKQIKEDNGTRFKQLPNFLHLNFTTIPFSPINQQFKQNLREENRQQTRKKISIHQPDKSSLKSLSLEALISRQIYGEGLEEGGIFYHLKMLIEKVGERNQQVSSQKQNFFKLFKNLIEKHKQYEGDSSLSQNIKWYTSNQPPIYKLLNNLLRSTHKPTHIFYLQPFFKYLYLSIKSEQKNKSNDSQRCFVCYRGGLISIQQLNLFRNNVGGFVRNYGFLSTSLDKRITRNFMKNLLIQIRVHMKEDSDRDDNGFAKIQKLSEYESEKEVLFNPLNTFYVLEVKIIHSKKKNSSKDNKNNSNAQNEKYNIVLEYVSSTKNFKKSNKFIQLLKSQQLKKKRYQILQGDCLVKSYQYETAIKYWKKYIQIVQSNQQGSKDKGWDLKKFIAYDKIGDIYQERREYQVALSYYQKCIQILRSNSGYSTSNFKSFEYGAILNKKGLIYQKQGKYRQALKQYKRFQEIAYRNSSKCILEQRFFGIKCNIANLLFKMGRQSKSKKIFKRYFNFFSPQNQLAQQSPPFLSEMYNMMGIINESQGKVQDAIKYYSLALYLKQAYQGINSINYCRIQYNIGLLHAKLGYFESAYRIFNKFSNKAFEVFGKNVQQGKAQAKIGYIMIQQGYASKGLGYLSESLQIIEKYLGKQSIEYAEILSNFGLYNLKILNYEKSLKYYQQCLNIYQLIEGKNGNKYACVICNIGSIYLKMEKIKQALICYSKALQVFGKNDQGNEYAILLSNIGILRLKQNRYTQGLELLERSRQIFSKIYEKNNSIAVKNCINIGLGNLNTKDYLHAQKQFGIAAQLRLEQYGQGLFHAEAVKLVAKAYEKMGKIPEYIQTIQKIHEQILKYEGEDSASYIQVLKLQSQGLKKLKQWQKSLKINQQICRILSKSRKVRKQANQKKNIDVSNVIKEMKYIKTQILKEQIQQIKKKWQNREGQDYNQHIQQYQSKGYKSIEVFCQNFNDLRQTQVYEKISDTLDIFDRVLESQQKQINTPDPFNSIQMKT